ncbi:MAG TPA: excinuclease ABC subunit UvrA [Candidatus Moranbacteria bacterium]|nr:excinuclease ABC subunit UvrA [Candidatus Moranbacteria bacterium]
MPKNILKSKESINVYGARTNNLKNINVSIPKNKLVVITGLSGSGKSSLAFDVIYAEGNRRYLEGMSSYALQFMDVSAKPDVDKIENLSPTISIDQKSVTKSPRSTVGTLTEIYDYLRVLFSKVGTPYCPNCGNVLKRVSNREILEEILKMPDNTQLVILSRILEKEKNTAEILRNVNHLGYARVRFSGKIITVQEALNLAKDIGENAIEIVIDRLTFKRNNPDKERILDSVETAFRLGKGFMSVIIDNDTEKLYNRDFCCNQCYFKISDVTPKNFSFNNPEGACIKCSGLGMIREIDEDLLVPNKKLTIAEGAILAWGKSNGKSGLNGSGGILKTLGERHGFSVNVPVKKMSRKHLDMIFYGCDDPALPAGKFSGVIPALKKKYDESMTLGVRSDLERYMIRKICPECLGKRLKKDYLSILVSEKSIDDVSNMDADNFIAFLKEVEKNKLSQSKKEIVAPLIKEMILRAQSLKNVGLDYLSLSRGADSISGGEAQRIRLATQLDSELSGIIYVLDEPSIGLHSRDTKKLINTLIKLKNTGNSLIVVEHDEDIIRQADWIIDMGPGAGTSGGEIIFSGNIKKLLKSRTLTAKFLTEKEKNNKKKKPSKGSGKFLEIRGATEHNLKNINVKIPLGNFVAITGLSGSGKSTLVADILSKALSRYFYKSKDIPGEHKEIRGIENIGKVISINQSPIGRTPRSNAATYTGVFSHIRELFSQTPESKNSGYDSSRFSFNIRGGRCEDCQGDGTKKIEMHMLPDMYVRCETCGGTRYNQKTLDIEYQGVNIAQVLDMSISYALHFFKKSPLIFEKLKTLEEVGLGYLKLGQSATNLSGGEAQRIKLATELSRRSAGKTLYILDEPTIGLHFEDVKKLLGVLNALCEKGNTVLVVEHNPDVIKNSDWVIDLGPEGGNRGGEIVYEGNPSGLKKCKRSWTGRYL